MTTTATVAATVKIWSEGADQKGTGQPPYPSRLQLQAGESRVYDNEGSLHRGLRTLILGLDGPGLRASLGDFGVVDRETGGFVVIMLADDGTLDTVLSCSRCGEELRYNFQAASDDDQDYEEFVSWAIDDATDDHTCRRD